MFDDWKGCRPRSGAGTEWRGLERRHHCGIEHHVDADRLRKARWRSSGHAFPKAGDHDRRGASTAPSAGYQRRLLKPCSTWLEQDSVFRLMMVEGVLDRGARRAGDDDRLGDGIDAEASRYGASSVAESRLR